MTDKTQPTAHAEITAPISADLRGMLGLSAQDAGLFQQAASMLDGLQNDERNRGNCSTAEGAACSADAVRRLAVQLLRSTETAQCLHQGGEPDKHMTIGRALREGLRAEPWISGGPGAAACVGLCAIQLQGWWHTAETAKAYADAYNRGADDMRAALQAAPPAPAAVAVPAEPTLDMKNAGWRTCAQQGIDPETIEVEPIFLAMLAAAPAQEHATQLAGQEPPTNGAPK